jgi:hypothetical protein
MPMGVETEGEKHPKRRTIFWEQLKQRLLLFTLRQAAFQLVHTPLEAQVLQAQEIETIQQLFALDICPFQRAL